MSGQQSVGGEKMSPFAIVTAVVAGGAAFYFMSEYAGPYRWAAELQMAVLGSFSQKLSFLLAFLMAWAAVGVVALPFRKALGGGGRGAGAATAAGGNPHDSAANLPPLPVAPGQPMTPAAMPPVPVELPPAKRPAGRLADLGLALLLMGGVFAFLGGRDYLRASAAGPSIEPATVEQFEAGRPPASTWVRVDAVPLVDEVVNYGSSRRGGHAYVPLVSAKPASPTTTVFVAGPSETRDGTSLPRGGVRLFAKFGSKTSPSGHVEGLVAKNDLPGPVRTAMEEAGLLQPGDHWVIEAGKDPAKLKSTSGLFLLIGAGAVVVGALLNVGRLRRR